VTATPPGSPGAAPAGDPLPDEAFAAALAALPGMGPARLAAILAVEAAPAAWDRLVAGVCWRQPAVRLTLGRSGESLFERWRSAARTTSPAAGWSVLVEAGVGVALHGSPSYPPALAGDIEPPALLFHRGTPEVIAGPRVAVVGTRRCTGVGKGLAHEIGRDLAAAGVGVVSGLASGIDGAAHRGAVEARGAPPIGVVGSGLDVVYPSDQDELWRTVAGRGVLLSEAPLGARPERWRFPARNRIIAALADLVVVVESHRQGGSLHTVDEADRRGVDVLVVPGSVRSPASAGTNDLLAEGRAPVCSADDVILALGLCPGGRRDRRDTRPAPGDEDAGVLDALGWQPATLDQLVLRTGHDIGRLTLALLRLEAAGWATAHGGWWERVAGGADTVAGVDRRRGSHGSLPGDGAADGYGGPGA
jgi:DNA processing protein